MNPVLLGGLRRAAPVSPVGNPPTLQVTNLAGEQENDYAHLTWTPTEENDKQVLMWSHDSGVSYSVLESNLSTTEYEYYHDILRTYAAGVLRYYLFTRNSFGDGPNSNVATVSTGVAPETPTLLDVSVNATGATLVWNTVTAGSSVRVQVNDSRAPGWVDAPNGAPSGANPTAADVETYLFHVFDTPGEVQSEFDFFTFRVRAEKSGLYSDYSAPVYSFGSPYIDDLSAAWSGGTRFAVSWNVGPAVGLSVLQYFIERRINGGSPVIFPSVASPGIGGVYMYDEVLNASLNVVSFRVRYDTVEFGVGPWGASTVATIQSGFGSVPTVIDGGIVLQADDSTWHKVELEGAYPNIHTNVVQAAVADPLWRAYAIIQAAGTFDNFRLRIIKDPDGVYTTDDGESTAEDFDFADGSPLVLTSPDEAGSYDYLAGQFAVTFETDAEGTRLTPVVPE